MDQSGRRRSQLRGGAFGGRWELLLQLVCLLLLQQQLLLPAAAAADDDEDLQRLRAEADSEPNTESEIPFLEDGWESPSPSPSPAPLETVKPAAAGAAAAAAAAAGKSKGNEDNSKASPFPTPRYERHALREPPRKALQLLAGDTAVTKRQEDRLRSETRRRQMQRDNLALQQKQQELQGRFDPETDIAERDAKLHRPNKLKQLLKYILYFLNNGGELPKDGFANDI